MPVKACDASGSAPNLVTAMTIDNSQKVGIGTTAPASLLHVDEGAADDCRIIAETHAGGDSMILFSQGASGAGSPTWGIGLDAGSGTSDGLSIGFEDTGYNDFSLTGDSKVVIGTDGNVGIGTTNPTAKLHVYTSGAEGINIGLQNSERYWKMQTDGGYLTFNDVSAGDLA